MKILKNVAWIIIVLALLTGLSVAAWHHRQTRKTLLVTGYAATYEPNMNDWRFTRECLRSSVSDLTVPIAVTFNHDNNLIVGVVTTAWVDETGLVVVIKIARTPYGQAMSDLIRDEIITGFSLEFATLESTPEYDIDLDKSIILHRRIRIVGICLTARSADSHARVICYEEVE